MGSRELRRLIEDNEAWLRRPGNHGQPRIVLRLRSSERNHRRHATDQQQQSFTNAINERGRRQARSPPQHRGQESLTERSRSPISRVPIESSRTTGDRSWNESLTTTSAFTVETPNSIPESRTPREDPSPGRIMGESYRDDGSQANGSAAFEFIFSPQNPILPSCRLGRTSGESDTNSHQAESQFPNPIPPSVRFRAAVNHLFNMLNEMQEMDDMRPAMSQMQLPPPPAERWNPPPNRTLQIDILQTRNWSPQEDTGSCVICLTEYQMGEQLTELRCKHKFHQTCILTWLQSNANCPLCRKNCTLTMS
ncbi:uncharacterized protein ACNLHF_012014 [Anomaloglossus baeobatrachus]|uniref:uncharacterized protein LOC142295334 n=1 Tax=Anomaloglossus baeobatrachus TaxID=238106 RepID=UPI003F4F5438